MRIRNDLYAILALLLVARNLVSSTRALLMPSTAPHHLKQQKQQQPLRIYSTFQRNDSALHTLRGGAIPREQQHDKPWIDGVKNSLASALAAGCSKALLAPFDTIKTMQQHHHSTGGGALSLWQAIEMIIKRPKGGLELYAGLGVAVVGSMPSVGLYFGVYSYCKQLLGPHLQQHYGKDSKYKLNNEALWMLGITTSAAIGNTVASFSRVPYEVVKQNLQTGVYSSTWTAMSTMARQGGARAFFPMGGVPIQMLRDIPYAMVTLLCYELLKQRFAPIKERRPESKALLDCMTGAIAGGIGTYVTNPLDVIKTRLQTNPQLFRGSIRICAQATWDEGGPMAFLRGSVPRLLHKVPANGCFFFFYEFFRTLLHVEQGTTATDETKK